jgi:mycofactocin precursor
MTEAVITAPDTDELAGSVIDETPPAVTAEATEPLVEADLLVEDVSIDGMCGVY